MILYGAMRRTLHQKKSRRKKGIIKELAEVEAIERVNRIMAEATEAIIGTIKVMNTEEVEETDNRKEIIVEEAIEKMEIDLQEKMEIGLQGKMDTMDIEEETGEDIGAAIEAEKEKVEETGVIREIEVKEEIETMVRGVEAEGEEGGTSITIEMTEITTIALSRPQLPRKSPKHRYQKEKIAGLNAVFTFSVQNLP